MKADPREETTSLVIMSQASRMLAEATTIQKAKELKDLSLVAADWARRKNMGEEAIQYCRSYALMAERKMGEMLAVAPKHPGVRMHGGIKGKTGGHVIEPPVSAPPTLAELGLTKKESSEAQAIAAIPEAEFQEVLAGEKSAAEVVKAQRRKKSDGAREAKREETAEAVRASQIKALIHQTDGFAFDPGPVDLLLTDPPYSTDVDDIASFAPRVIALLKHVKPTGRAYVCIGAYPKELRAYLSAAPPKHMALEQVLAWTFRNVIGPKLKMLYRLNWQAILYYVGKDAPPLDCPELNELFAVQDISAPDGRHDGRLHPWQKPDALAERFVRHATQPGQIVFDPFAGTGTFLIQAATLGRHAVGCETDDAMLEIAVERGCKHEERRR